MRCMSVDLPDPELPMIAMNSPASTEKLASFRAVTAVSPVPYTRVRCSTVRMFMVVLPSCRLVSTILGFRLFRTMTRV